MEAATSPVLMSREKRRSRESLAFRDREATSALLLLMLGAAFLVIGLADLALLWMPLAIGNPVWEFGTVSGTFDNMPISALGITLLTFGLLRHPGTSAVWLRLASLVFGAATLILVTLGLIYALATPAVLNQAAPETLVALRGTIVKNVVEVVAYVLAFGLMTIVTWRGAAREAKAATKTK